jgi:hypothetical protein
MTTQAQLIVQAATDFTAAVTLGTLYLDYVVKFFVPHLQESVTFAASQWDSTGSATTTDILPSAVQTNSSGITVTKAASTSAFTIHETGKFVVQYTNDVATTGLGVITQAVSSGTTASLTYQGGNGANARILRSNIVATAQDWTLTYTAASGTTGAVTVNRLYIFKVPDTFSQKKTLNDKQLTDKIESLELKIERLLRMAEEDECPFSSDSESDEESSEEEKKKKKYDKCKYCGMDPPDHPGRDCSMKPNALDRKQKKIVKEAERQLKLLSKKDGGSSTTK